MTRNRFSEGDEGSQHNRVHFQVHDVIIGTDDRPDISPHSVESFRVATTQMMGRNPHAFTMDIMQDDATTLSLLWTRAGATAGHAVWNWKGMIYAVTFYLGGIDDADDAKSIATIDVNLPARVIDHVRELERPVAATVYLGNEAVKKTPITAAAIGLGQTLFQEIQPTTHPPLGDAPPHPPSPKFYHVIVNAGKVAADLWPSLDILAMATDMADVIEAFTQRLREEPDGFESRLHFRQWPEIRVVWRSLHETAGVASLTYAGQGLAQTLLFLSGKDDAADTAAISAVETLMKDKGESSDLANTFTRIRTAQRPLLVTFGSTNLDETDISVELIQWGLAAAYFQHVGAM